MRQPSVTHEFSPALTEDGISLLRIQDVVSSESGNILITLTNEVQYTVTAEEVVEIFISPDNRSIVLLGYAAVCPYSVSEEELLHDKALSFQLVARSDNSVGFRAILNQLLGCGYKQITDGSVLR